MRESPSERDEFKDAGGILAALRTGVLHVAGTTIIRGDGHAARMLAEAELAGRSILSFCPDFQPGGASSSTIWHSNAARARKGEDQTFDWTFELPGSVALDTEVTLRATRDDRLLVLITDATRRKHAENALARKLAFMGLLRDIQVGSLTALGGQVDSAIAAAVRNVCRYFGADEAVLWYGSEQDPVLLRAAHIFAEAGVARIAEGLVANNAFPWVSEQILRRRTVAISDFETLPHDADADVRELKRLGVESLLTVPFAMGETEVGGALSLGGRKGRPQLSSTLIDEAELSAQLFASAVSRKRSDAMARAEQSRLRDAQLIGGIGDWEYDIRTRAITWSEQMYKLFRRDEARGSPSLEEVIQYLHPGEAAADLAYFETALREGREWEMETRILFAGDEVAWFHHKGVPVCNERGEAVRFRGTTQNITSLKRIEVELRTSEQRFEDVLFNGGDWVWELDRNWHITFSSQKGLEWFGSQADGLLGKTPFALMPYDEARRLERVFMEAAEREAPIREMENIKLRANGERLHLLTTAVPVIDESGVRTGYRGVDRDITSRKLAEDDRARLALAIEQSAESIVMTDAFGEIIYVNPEFEKTTGYTREEALGKNPRILRSGRQSSEFYEEMWDRLISGEVWRGRFWNRRKDGTEYLETATISPVRDQSGRIVNYIAVKLDVSREEELKTQLNQSQKMESLGRLASGVAHDFNNLLTVINGYSQLAMAELPQNSPLRSELREIEVAGERAASLTRQLLAFSRKQSLQPRVLSLNGVAEGMRSMLRRLVGEDLKLQFIPDPGQPAVYADPHQLEQVIMNLVVNARDAMPGGGLLTIQTALSTSPANHEPVAVLSVTDTGIGMDKATLGRIFEPFFTTKARDKGTGLGLSTVLGIVEQSGGTIEVDSEPGRGTCFRICLPLAVQSPAQRPGAPNSAPIRGTESVLVVEDQEEVLAFIVDSLRLYGYTVIPASSAREALDFCRTAGSATVDVVLSDVVMPDTSGPALVEQMRRTQPTMKCVFMSGYAAGVIESHGGLATTDSFIEKPFTAHELASKIRQALSSGASVGADSQGCDR